MLVEVHVSFQCAFQESILEFSLCDYQHNANFIPSKSGNFHSAMKKPECKLNSRLSRPIHVRKKIESALVFLPIL